MFLSILKQPGKMPFPKLETLLSQTKIPRQKKKLGRTSFMYKRNTQGWSKHLDFFIMVMVMAL